MAFVDCHPEPLYVKWHAETRVGFTSNVFCVKMYESGRSLGAYRVRIELVCFMTVIYKLFFSDENN